MAEKENSIVLTNNNTKEIYKLIGFIPDEFIYVPVIIGKDEEGNPFTSVKTIDTQGNMVFSGTVMLPDDIKELDKGSAMAIRLSTNKNLVDTVFNSDCESIEVSKSSIKINTKNVKLNITMLNLDEDDLVDYPENGKELFSMAVQESDGKYKEIYDTFALDFDETKEFLSCIGVLSPAKPDDLKFTIATKKDNVVINCEDYIKNSFEYVLNNVSTKNKYNSTYDINLIKVLQKLTKFKDCSIETLISDAVITFTIEEPNINITIGVPAFMD